MVPGVRVDDERGRGAEPGRARRRPQLEGGAVRRAGGRGALARQLPPRRRQVQDADRRLDPAGRPLPVHARLLRADVEGRGCQGLLEGHRAYAAEGYAS